MLADVAAIVGSLDILSPVRVSDDITGSVKLGGKIQYRVRSYDYDQSDGAVLVSGGGLRQAILDAFPWMKQQVPTGVAPLPITLFEDGVFSYGKFLGGDYTMGAPINIALLQPVINIARQFGQLEAWSHNALASMTNDYSGSEHQGAVYAMLTANLGGKITLLGGARYQNLETSYKAPRGQETNTSHFNYNPRDTTIDESQGRWLPMAHLIYRPCVWLQVRFAYTNTLAYPDYNTITPRIDLGFSSVSWNNFALKESHSSNSDLVVSLLDNGIGLFLGPAGTGKTYLAVAMAVAALKAERLHKIVLVRPAVEAGESLGFLPGDLQAKINPYPAQTPATDQIEVVLDNFDSLVTEKKKVSVNGRIRSIRWHGGSCFIKVEDSTGKIQAYFKKDELTGDS